MSLLQIPDPESVFYEDDRLYICLAAYPITKGHTIVAWKDEMADLHLLNKVDYEYLMDKVDLARNALLKQYNLEKVYLMYLDEVKQVHWHLVPRYNEQGFNVFMHEPIPSTDFEDVAILRDVITHTDLT